MCLRRGIYRAGEIVHHLEELTPENITIPEIALGWDNLELVCRDCHAEAHEQRKRRFKVLENGQIAPL